MSSNTLTVWWGSGSPMARKVLFALHEKNIPFESKLLKLDQKEHKTPEFLAMNPRGKIPTIKHGDTVVYESDAILQYLEETYPEHPLLPTDKNERTLAYMRWREAENMTDVLFRTSFVDFLTRKKNVEEHKGEWEKVVSQINEELKFWEKYLEGKQFLAGNTFSLADIALYCFFGFLTRVGKDWAADTQFPNIGAWYQRVDSREAAKATYPPHWKESPGAKCF